MIRLKETSPFGSAPLFFKPETESTQTDVKNLALQGLPSGTAVMTGSQLAGRGRFAERKWAAGPGSLCFSVLFQLQDFPSLSGAIPLRTGLALAAALEKSFGLTPEIKWPNDVLLKGRKVSGILVESREEHVFIGIGINCGSRSYARELKKTAISLEEAGAKCEPKDFFIPVLEQMKEWILGGENWKEEIERRLYAKGKIVAFLPGISDGQEAFEALLVGIEEDGQLLLQPEGAAAPRAFANGELRYTPPKRSFFSSGKKE